MIKKLSFIFLFCLLLTPELSAKDGNTQNESDIKRNKDVINGELDSADKVTAEGDGNIKLKPDKTFFSISSINIEGIEDNDQKNKVLFTLKKIIPAGIDIKDYILVNKIRKELCEKCSFVNDFTLEYEINEDDNLDLYFLIKSSRVIRDFDFGNASTSDLKDKYTKLKNKTYDSESNLIKIKNDFWRSFDTEIYDIYIKVKEKENGETYINFSKEEKEKMYISKVLFEGNKEIKDEELINGLSLTGSSESIRGIINNTIDNFSLENIEFLKKQGLRFLDFFLQKGKKTFLKGKLKEDIKTIIDIYHNQGFLNAKVREVRIECDKKNSYCNIVYVIEEGEKYYVGGYKINSTKVFSGAYLRGFIDIKKGEVFNIGKIYKKVQGGAMNDMNTVGLKTLFTAAGYNDCSIRIKIDKVVGNEVFFSIIISAGWKKKVGTVSLIGNKNTSFKYILPNVSLLPGNDFSNRDIMGTQYSLMQNKVIKENTVGVAPVQDPRQQQTGRDIYKQDINCCFEEKSFIVPKAAEIRGTLLKNIPWHILPVVTISLKFINVNLGKLWPSNWQNKKIRWLGDLDDAGFELKINFADNGDKDWYFNGSTGFNATMPNYKIFGYSLPSSFLFKFEVMPPSDKQERKNKNGFLNFLTTRIGFNLSYSLSSSFKFLGKGFDCSFSPWSFSVSRYKKEIQQSISIIHNTTFGNFFIKHGWNFKMSFNFSIFRFIPLFKEFSSRAYFMTYLAYYKEISFLPLFSRKSVIMFSGAVGFTPAFLGENYFSVSSAGETSGGPYGNSYNDQKINKTSFYIRGLDSEHKEDEDKDKDKNFGFRLNFEFRYPLFTGGIIQVFPYFFANTAYVKKIDWDILKNEFKNLKGSIIIDIFTRMLYCGVGVAISLPLFGETSLSISFSDINKLIRTNGVEQGG